MALRCSLVPRLEVKLYCDGFVVDEQLVSLLIAVDKYGSILRAARAVGLAYSRAWECIARAEHALGVKLVEARRGGRGGGGARLTEAGRELIARFVEAYRSLTGQEFQPSLAAAGERVELGVYAGSHDIAVERLLGILRGRGVVFEAHWLGSIRGVASVLLEEADVAGIHIYTGEGYNIPYLRNTLPRGVAVLVKGYERLLGFVSREQMSLDEILEGIIRGRLRLVNRQKGTGTRLVLDDLLAREAKRHGIDPAKIPEIVKGYSVEARTHMEVAGVVARGEADVGLALQAAALLHGLSFTPVRWEQFDFLIPRSRLKTRPVEQFLEALSSKEFHEVLSTLPGYRVASNTGDILEL
ncbi:substrate-binding domain-containing protein [Hyperthermus butylicus]|uniref:Molybdate-binding protein, periplasmic component n=1 Tax=Hyperthermus butylicus (strain DSM 5456 / JCM 9403 / PLM1-5) TaxID=415426 RepID=A2BJP7_HYPBU|nr:substrate-binding domain-containing protein [Hyperthermus butylicus]ABM80208.1 Molybdate-binding protein, periplasmic component [Hyperthermus butylicus DSM 5456]